VNGEIGAVAAVNRLTLLTANTADFDSFTDLAVVPWHSMDVG
jgi:predicted nucleic acid-binding protein